ncbi:1128_t:CDS:1, partial [Gigaspora margarita]
KLNEHEFHGNFHTAKELLKSKNIIKSCKHSLNFTSKENKYQKK